MATPATKSTNTTETSMPVNANEGVTAESSDTKSTNILEHVQCSVGNQMSSGIETPTAMTEDVTKSMNTLDDEPNIPQLAPDTENNDLKSMNTNTNTHAEEMKTTHLDERGVTISTDEAQLGPDTTEQESADGLLILQQLAEMDPTDPNDADHPPLIPLVQDFETLDDMPVGTTEAPTPSKPVEADNSDDTIIYDPNDYLPPEDPAPPKGVLTITEVGIRSRPSTSSDPVGPVTSEGKLRCDYCKRSFNTRSEKLQHINRRHADRTHENTSKDAKDKTANTSQTTRTKSTNIKTQLKPKKSTNRRKNSGQSKPKPKPNDSRKDKSNKNTKSNNKRENKNTRKDNANSRIRRYRCPKCTREFEMQSELNQHYKKHHPPVKCRVCGKLCATPNTLSRHMYKHKDRPHKCDYCTESFAFKSELDGHLITHQGEPGFFCEDCDKSFMRYQDLVKHELTHSGIRHKCTVKGCNYSAKDERYVKIHMKTTHSKEEDYLYPCELCEETFKFYEQRKQHYSTYH